jgi:hypothetical protein
MREVTPLSFGHSLTVFPQDMAWPAGACSISHLGPSAQLGISIALRHPLLTAIYGLNPVLLLPGPVLLTSIPTHSSFSSGSQPRSHQPQRVLPTAPKLAGASLALLPHLPVSLAVDYGLAGYLPERPMTAVHGIFSVAGTLKSGCARRHALSQLPCLRA